MIRRMYLNGKEKLEARRIIQEKTGYIFKSTSILNQIFRRSSFSSETGQNSNEIFEFIGDQVLSYYVVKVVSEKCGSLSLTDDYTFRIRENRFTLIKQALVNNETLAKIIDEWGVVDYLLVGKPIFSVTTKHSPIYRMLNKKHICVMYDVDDIIKGIKKQIKNIEIVNNDYGKFENKFVIKNTLGKFLETNIK